MFTEEGDYQGEAGQRQAEAKTCEDRGGVDSQMPLAGPVSAMHCPNTVRNYRALQLRSSSGRGPGGWSSGPTTRWYRGVSVQGPARKLRAMGPMDLSAKNEPLNSMHLDEARRGWLHWPLAFQSR